VLAELDSEGYPIEKVVLVSGIGCHAKIVDYMNVNSFYSIHGRTLPAASAIKIANPDLKVICFSGMEIAWRRTIIFFAAKRNIDLTMILHDNNVYGDHRPVYHPLGFKASPRPRAQPSIP
jgi:2-oxoglutarate ferredoxin oxidoreductase subunit beta